MHSTPIVLIIFNRPEHTRRVFEAISQIKPQKLFVISDGPRTSRPNDKRKVAECRSIVSGIDWECEVEYKISDINLGCKTNVSSGLDWVFSKVDDAIILEDDCLPSANFYQFCHELLERYRDDLSVGSICGTNLDSKTTMNLEHSYYYSYFPAVWGWATWKRVWENYEVDLGKFTNKSIRSTLGSLPLSAASKRFWAGKFKAVRSGKVDTWDYQLVFAHWRLGLRSIISKQNSISNIGFGPDATHTLNSNSEYSALSREYISFPLIHPDEKEALGQLEQKYGMPVYEDTLLRSISERLYLALPKNLQALAKWSHALWLKARN